jgi:hypothetical protein
MNQKNEEGKEMDVEPLLHKLHALLNELGGDTRDIGESPYTSLALDSLVSVMNVIRAAELTIAAGASRTTVDDMLRAHMLGRMQREAALMVRLAEQPAAEMEALLRSRQSEARTSEPNPTPRKPRPRTSTAES